MESRRLTLPQVCRCGARGQVTLEGAPDPGPDAEHPRPMVIEATGSFSLDDLGGIVCQTCGARTG